MPGTERPARIRLATYGDLHAGTRKRRPARRGDRTSGTGGTGRPARAAWTGAAAGGCADGVAATCDGLVRAMLGAWEIEPRRRPDDQRGGEAGLRGRRRSAARRPPRRRLAVPIRRARRPGDAERKLQLGDHEFDLDSSSSACAPTPRAPGCTTSYHPDFLFVPEDAADPRVLDVGPSRGRRRALDRRGQRSSTRAPWTRCRAG